MTAQDSQSELDEILERFRNESIWAENIRKLEEAGNVYPASLQRSVWGLTDAKQAIEAYVITRVKEAEKNGVAWTIGIIDEMHEMDIEKNGGVMDSQYKGIKNGIRAMYEQDTGNGDPAPNYPINVALTTTTNGKDGE